MAGIYIHIPFCKKACHYCDFHFSTATKGMPELINAIQLEAAIQQNYLSEKVETIYFGGGTPSLMTKEEVQGIISLLKEIYDVSADAEITLEANPDDVTKEKCTDWKELGINRLSIGIQSFFEEDLRWMNRAHNASQAVDCIAIAKASGFENITIDLIYGTPSLTDEHWAENINKALSFQIPHLSCYALTVEPKTALAKMIAENTVADVDPDKQARHFALLRELLGHAGFEQYEISNFSTPGFRSRHNSAYWQGKHYLGLGPSAHSFNGTSRQWNIRNNALYVKSIEEGNIPYELEILTDKQQLNEYIMTSLRTIEGISLERVKRTWGNLKAENLLIAAKRHLDEGYVLRTDNSLQLSASGKFLADGIASDLFSV
jgi:oxygen-independent coproporphyrinogen-3 oxidase